MKCRLMILFGVAASAVLAQPAPPPHPAIAPTPPSPRVERIHSRMPEDALYSAGARAIDRRQWDRAIEAYDAVIAKNGTRAEGALYWKAYALARVARADEASATLRELESRYPKSRWLDDARALEIEIRQSMGKPVSPEEQQNEELKLIAIHGLAGQDPARAVPLLEKVLAGNGSISLKNQALFVLSQVRHPRSREILLDYAKGKGNPDLQIRAVEILGMTSSVNMADLMAIYASNPDKPVKRALLNAFAMKREAKPLIDIARNEQDPDLRREAVQRLTMINSKEASEFLAELLEK